MGSSCYAAYYYQDLKEWYIYGSESDGRISVLKPYVNEFTDHLHKNAIHLFDQAEPYAMKDTIIEYQANTIGSFTSNARITGHKEYEILVLSVAEVKDHLGNVRAVISDVKNPHNLSSSISSWTFTAEIRNLSNYYSYGMQIPNGIYSKVDDYGYGYNGMEKDDELKGSGKLYSTLFREGDTENGRWWSRDPLEMKLTSFSPYVMMGGNPIIYVDPDGRKNIPALLWARKNMSNKNIKSNYSDPWFGGSDNRWTYEIGDVPTRAVCYESCFISYMNSTEEITSYLKKTGFSNKYNAFKGRSTKEGGMNWFKKGDGTDRAFITNISEGELGDIVFMGEVGDMLGHAVLLNELPIFGTYEDEDGNTIETVTLNTLSTSSDSDSGSFGERQLIFEKQSNGTWKQQSGSEYIFRGYGQLNADKFSQEEIEEDEKEETEVEESATTGGG